MKSLLLPATLGAALCLVAPVAQAGQLALTGDAGQTSGSIGGGEIEGTLNDTFAYNPLLPTAPLPNQSFAGGDGYHGLPGGGTIAYLLDDSYANLFIDLYGRDSETSRDNALTIQFYNGSWTAGDLTEEITGFNVPDAAPYYARVIATPGTQADRFSISYGGAYFTMMEVRASGIVPEPATGLLMISGAACIGLRRRRA